MHLSFAALLGASFVIGNASAATLTWALAGGGAWDITTANWTGDATTFVSDGTQDVIFNKAGGGTITVAAGMEPLSTTVSASGNYTFSGGAIAGSGPLTKAGNGVLTMNAVNTYTGKTTVEAGTLLLSTSVYLSNAGVDGPLGAPTGADATIELHNGTTFRMGSTSPRKNQITNRTLDLAGTGAGTVSLRLNDNDTLFQFAAVTATGTGAKTFAVFTGHLGNGDREAVTFTGAIEDSSDASPTSLAVTFRGVDSNWVSLSGVNTFTGPITLARHSGTALGTLVVGGAKGPNGGAETIGTGSLGNGNYPGTISLGPSTLFNYLSTTPQILAGVISGAGAMKVTGSGQVTLSAANTYTGNTTVNGGCTLALDAAGALSFSVTDSTATKLTGGGTANLDGTFNIDTSAVTVPVGSWPLVDTTSKMFGSTFNVVGFFDPEDDGVWTKEVGVATWTFSEADGTLSVNTPATFTSFGVPGQAGIIDQATKTISLFFTYGTDLTGLAPDFTVTSGTVTANGNAVSSGASPSPGFEVMNPATYTVTDGAAVINYTVNMIAAAPPGGVGVADGLVAWFDAGAGTATDGSGVATWADKSGNGHTATRAQGTMQITPGAINSLPAVRFAGNAYAPIANSMYSKTQFIVTKMDGGDWGAWMGSQVQSGYMWNPNGTCWNGNIPAAAAKNGRALAGPTFNLAPGHNIEYMILKIVGNDNNVTPRLYDLGRQQSWLSLNNYMAEIITYDRVLTSDEENDVGFYLAQKYGVTTTYTGGSAYDTWAADNGLDGTAGKENGINDDPEGDGHNNLMEYAFGTDPLVGSGASITYVVGGDVTATGQPVAVNFAEGGGMDFHAVFGRRKDHVAAGLTYTVQFSAGLDQWVDNEEVPTLVTDAESAGDIDAMSVPYPLSIDTINGTETPTFFRVKVSMAP